MRELCGGRCDGQAVSRPIAAEQGKLRRKKWVAGVTGQKKEREGRDMEKDTGWTAEGGKQKERRGYGEREGAGGDRCLFHAYCIPTAVISTVQCSTKRWLRQPASCHHAPTMTPDMALVLSSVGRNHTKRPTLTSTSTAALQKYRRLLPLTSTRKTRRFVLASFKSFSTIRPCWALVL